MGLAVIIGPTPDGYDAFLDDFGVVERARRAAMVAALEAGVPFLEACEAGPPYPKWDPEVYRGRKGSPIIWETHPAPAPRSVAEYQPKGMGSTPTMSTVSPFGAAGVEPTEGSWKAKP